jgi:O-antigen ligase
VAIFGVLAMAVVMLFPTQYAASRLEDDVSAYYRINLWYGGLKMAAEKPLLGFGFGQFRENIYRYHEPVAGVTYTPIPSTGQVAHNTIVHVLVEHGLLGLLLYGWIFFRVVTRARDSSVFIFSDQGSRWVLGLALVYLINAQFIVAYESVTNLIFYGTLGLIAGLEKTKEGK